jgi:hypothetical protein
MCPTPNGSYWSHTFRSHSTLVVSAFEGLPDYDPTEMTGGFEQDPEAETEIQRGTAVDLVVSTGRLRSSRRLPPPARRTAKQSTLGKPPLRANGPAARGSERTNVLKARIALLPVVTLADEGLFGSLVCSQRERRAGTRGADGGLEPRGGGRRASHRRLPP